MRICLVLTIAASYAWAQTPAASPKFEVASVKLVNDYGAPPDSTSFSPRRSGARFSWTITPIPILGYAFRVPSWRIQGIKCRSCFYTIEATAPPETTDEQLRIMVQTLLKERLHLAMHWMTAEMDGYHLVVAKNGPKLQQVGADGKLPPMPDYLKGKSPEAFEGGAFASLEGVGVHAITGRGVPVARLANQLSEELGTFVIDKTGITGKQYFGFRFLENASGPELGVPNLFNALQENLGLKLERQKGPVEILVIDQMDKAPTEN